MIVWRIEKRKYLETALSGEGARIYSGRWNSPGRPIVYTSGTLSLAALEKLVHLDRPGRRSVFLAVGIEIPDQSMTEIETASLAKGWAAELEFVATRRLGDQWSSSGASVALAVPSTIVPRERNYVLNPQHPDYVSVRIITIEEPFLFDPRLTA